MVSSSKDSLVQNAIRNIGSYGFRVDSIIFIGADASQFSIVSSLPPFEVEAQDLHKVEFRFQPNSSGVKSAQMKIFTQCDTVVQTITGVGYIPEVALMTSAIDFGQILIGSLRDTTISVAIKNNGSVPLTFTPRPQLGPDKKQFFLQSSTTVFDLVPGQSQSVKLRFAPKYIGRTSGRIAFDYNGIGSPAILTVFGQGLGGSVSLADDSAYMGDHRDIQMRLKKVPMSSVLSTVTNFSARILYDATILYPTIGNIAHGSRFDTVTVAGSLGIDSILMRIPFVAMLGLSGESPMNIVDFQWFDGSGHPADLDVETESATFRLLGICNSGGERLFNPNGTVAITRITPNPTSSEIYIDVLTVETGRTQLRITNILGEQVATLFDGELKPGLHTFNFSSAKFSAGSYYLTLRTPTVNRLGAH